MSLGLTVATIEPDHGKDWNEWLASGGTAEAFQASPHGREEHSSSPDGRGPTAATTLPKPDALTMTKDASRYLFTRAG